MPSKAESTAALAADPKPIEQPKPERKQDVATVSAHAFSTTNPRTGEANAKRALIRVAFGRMESKSAGFEGVEFSPEHEIAAQLHGWNAHEVATGKEFECTRDAYLAALAAANVPRVVRKAPPAPPKLGQRVKHQPAAPTYAPHPAATSPHAPHAIAKAAALRAAQK